MTEPTLAWDDVRLFLAIARAGTLSAAAPTLGLSQPTAGRRLRALEDAVGVALFAIITMDRAFDYLSDVVWLRTKLPRARDAVRSNSRDVQAEACVQNAGLAILPRIVGDALPLERIELDGEPPGRDVYVGYHRDLKRLGRLRAFLDHVRASLPKEI